MTKQYFRSKALQQNLPEGPVKKLTQTYKVYGNKKGKTKHSQNFKKSIKLYTFPTTN